MTRTPTIAQQQEKLRLRYRPSIVRLLFIGESPPAGGTFFYQADSNLSTYTQRAFEQATGHHWESGSTFLHAFQEAGCYLDDLCLDAVNHLPRAERQKRREWWVPSLAQRMSQHDPAVLISVMLGILPQVREARALAGHDDVPFYALPFPTMGHQPRYVEMLAARLRVLRNDGILEM